MDKDYFPKFEESKAAFHKRQAKMPFEDKFKIIIELQKLDCEMQKSNPNRKSDRKFRMVWKIQE